MPETYVPLLSLLLFGNTIIPTLSCIYIYMAGCRWHLLLKPDFPPWPAWGEFFGVFRGVGPNGPGPGLPSPARLRSVRVEH